MADGADGPGLDDPRDRELRTTVAQPIGPSSATLAVLTSFLWAGTPVAIKYSQDVLPPIGVAAVQVPAGGRFHGRLVCGMQRVVPEAWNVGQRRPALICGLLLYAQISLFHLGLHRLEPLARFAIDQHLRVVGGGDRALRHQAPTGSTPAAWRDCCWPPRESSWYWPPLGFRHPGGRGRIRPAIDDR